MWFEVNASGANTLLDVYNVSPIYRSSFASLLSEFIQVNFIGFSQYYTQRFVASESIKEARKSVWIFLTFHYGPT